MTVLAERVRWYLVRRDVNFCHVMLCHAMSCYVMVGDGFAGYRANASALYGASSLNWVTGWYF